MLVVTAHGGQGQGDETIGRLRRVQATREQVAQVDGEIHGSRRAIGQHRIERTKVAVYIGYNCDSHGATLRVKPTRQP
ncbi:hypothetical protein GCM10022198_19440 [Klugiella xanthotipulae]